jgi:hypothetical protein
LYKRFELKIFWKGYKELIADTPVARESFGQLPALVAGDQGICN